MKCSACTLGLCDRRFCSARPLTDASAALAAAEAASPAAQDLTSAPTVPAVPAAPVAAKVAAPADQCKMWAPALPAAQLSQLRTPLTDPSGVAQPAVEAAAPVAQYEMRARKAPQPPPVPSTCGFKAPPPPVSSTRGFKTPPPPGPRPTEKAAAPELSATAAAAAEKAAAEKRRTQWKRGSTPALRACDPEICAFCWRRKTCRPDLHWHHTFPRPRFICFVCEASRANEQLVTGCVSMLSSSKSTLFESVMGDANVSIRIMSFINGDGYDLMCLCGACKQVWLDRGWSCPISHFRRELVLSSGLGHGWFFVDLVECDDVTCLRREWAWTKARLGFRD